MEKDLQLPENFRLYSPQEIETLTNTLCLLAVSEHEVQRLLLLDPCSLQMASYLALPGALASLGRGVCSDVSRARTISGTILVISSPDTTALVLQATAKFRPFVPVLRVEGLPASTGLSTMDNAIDPSKKAELQTVRGGASIVHAFLMKTHPDFMAGEVCVCILL